MKTLTVNLFDHEYDILAEITEDFLGDEYTPENELAGMGTVLGEILSKYGRLFVKPELNFKIQELAKYHELGITQLITNLICEAYIEAENAGVVPVDPWKRNPNPDSVLENETFLWNSFPEALRDLHIEHEIDGHGDEDGERITIYIDDNDAKTDRVYMTKRYAWDEERQCFNPYRSWKLEIEIEVPTDELDERGKVRYGIRPLRRIKTLDQLFNEVFGMSFEQKKWERGYV